MSTEAAVERFIAEWAGTGGSELANTQSFVNGLATLIGVDPPAGSRTDDTLNDYVFERRVFQREADGTESFGRIDAYRRGSFVLEAKQGSDADRRAAGAGQLDLDLFGQSADVRLKRGTARRGTPAWARAMDAARGQAERYAKALPVGHGWPPFLLVTDVGHCIDVYADFTRTGKAYVQFPDAARFRIMLGDLHDTGVRERLRGIWTDPLSLDPAREAARVTREVADRLAILSKRLEERHESAEGVADFLMRCLFTMFAEDVGLLPELGFSKLLRRMRDAPGDLPLALASLWNVMDAGGWSGDVGARVPRFNGYLFKDRGVLPLEPPEIDLLIEAAERDWRQVEPAIFGTLLERALKAKERAKLGAHYTPRAYVERLVLPTVIEPLRAEWLGVRGAAAVALEADDTRAATRAVEAFHARLSGIRVLDPACGTGNFLYVTLARMKELEGEVIAYLRELGDDAYVEGLGLNTVKVENFLGIEVNPRAAAIAQLVLWIGYLQWHYRTSPDARVPPEPILRGVKTIECRDALIAWDDRVLERGPDGTPLTIWDGTSFKEHPITGALVPDEEGRLEVYRYVRPRATKWPKAEYILGNPPFIGNKRMRARLGDGYAEAIRAAYPRVSASVDFVMYWWDIAARKLGKVGATRFGFITTNSITQPFNRSVIERAGANLVFAIPDHPWVDGNDGAAVRIALTVAEGSDEAGTLSSIVAEWPIPNGYGETEVELQVTTGTINSDLTIGTDLTSASVLKANSDLAVQGMNPLGLGFRLDADDLARLRIEPGALPLNLKSYMIGRDITQRPQKKWVIDFYGLGEKAAREANEDLFQHLVVHVKPERDQQRRAVRRNNWWLFGENAPTLRVGLRSLNRMIATCRTAKHRIFVFLPADVIVDAKIIGIALDDALALGVVSSRTHLVWALATGGWLGVGNDSNYNHSDCFAKFPFPADVPPALAARIRDEAEALDAVRKRVLAAHPELTLTGLYNVLELLRANERGGRAFTEGERAVHDAGLVTLVRQHHDAIDAAVAEAYGWAADLPEAEILAKLVALNAARAAEEQRGLIRWLRPDYQNPAQADFAKGNEDLALGDAPILATATILPWPKYMADQFKAVAAVLAAAAVPLDERAVARAFQGKRVASVRPVLATLASMGQARRLHDGRYAA